MVVISFIDSTLYDTKRILQECSFVLNLLNALRKRDNKFNNTGAQMLDSINHMALKYLKHAVWCKNVPYFMQRYNGRHYVS